MEPTLEPGLAEPGFGAPPSGPGLSRPVDRGQAALRWMGAALPPDPGLERVCHVGQED